MKKMKTKTKTFALVEIAIVLCSVFLVALPGIAAAASELYEPGPLDVFGNANEDDTIDMRDTTYIKLVIFGKKPETKLADANNDGKVSMLDVGQTKLIILGKEKELTFVDEIGQMVTVHKPVERIIAVYYTVGETIRAIGAKNLVVGIDGGSSGSIQFSSTFFPGLGKKPCVGARMEMDIEKILELEPDAVILGKWHTKDLEDTLKGTGIDVVRVCPYEPETLRNKVMQLGYILDEVENARNYFEWHDGYINEIVEKVSGIPEDKKSKVFIDGGGSVTERNDRSDHLMTCEQAGGINIAANLGEQKTVEVEWIVEQNPDVIIGCSFGGDYETDDESVYKAHYDEIIGLPGFDQIKAVQDDRVYIINGRFGMGLATPIGTAYMAKWYHPELFEDLDPQEMHQEYVDKFCPGLDFDVRTEGVFVYPKPAW